MNALTADDYFEAVACLVLMYRQAWQSILSACEEYERASAAMLEEHQRECAAFLAMHLIPISVAHSSHSRAFASQCASRRPSKRANDA
jgi:hypothetical protein